ncbi:MAG: DUF4405 domain-containing protein [Anaerofustis sp.]
MKKNYLKYILDLVMTVVFILLMNTTVTGLKAHEVLGLGVCGLFIIHNLLNAKWIRTVASKLFDKQFKPLTKFMFVLDALILIDVLLIALSGVLISTELFSFTLNNRFLWVTIHHITAYGGLILISVHVGLHWKSILGAIRKLSGIRHPSKLRTALMRFAALAIAVLGIRSSIDLNMADKLFPFKTDETDTASVSDSTPLTDSVNAQSASAETTEPQAVLLYEQNRKGNGNGGEKESDEDDAVYSDGSSSTTTSSDTTGVTSGTTDASIPTLNEYLGSLRCTGCSRHCLLLYPQCSIGVRQAETATGTYHTLYDAALAAQTIDSSTSAQSADSISDQTSDSSDSVSEDITQIGAAELFSDYLPIMGLYIGGTYYTIELLGKKKKKDSRSL